MIDGTVAQVHSARAGQSCLLTPERALAARRIESTGFIKSTGRAGETAARPETDQSSRAALLWIFGQFFSAFSIVPALSFW